MKLICSLVLMAFAYGSTFAQTNPDEVIGKIIEAQGGKEKLLSIKTVRMTGNIEFSGQKIPFNFYGIDKTAERTEFSFSGLTGYTIVTKDSGFNFNPFQGQKTPENMTAEDVKLSQNDLDQQGILIDYKQKGYDVEQLENEDVDGVDAIQLKITITPNKTLYYFVDPASYYIIRIKTVSVSNGQQQRGSSDYYDFKKTKDGYMFPHTFDNITFDKIEVNVPLDDKLFKPTR
jgi:outer membrane lipoprotein-sorting protein